MTPIRKITHNYYYKANQILTHKGIGWNIRRTARSARFVSMYGNLHNPLQIEQTKKLQEAIALGLKSESVLIQSHPKTGEVEFQIMLPERYRMFFDLDKILTTGREVGVARISNDVPEFVNFELSNTSAHALVAGRQGSGKTETVRTILATILYKRTPDDVQVGIIDLKRSRYEEFDNAAHLINPIVFEPNDCRNMIRWFYLKTREKMEHSQFIDNGGTRYVLIIDEAESDVVLTDENKKLLIQIAHLGREYGIHLILSSQSPDRYAFGKIMANLGERYIGKVVDASASKTASGVKLLGCESLGGKGDFIYIGERTSAPVRFQVAKVTNSILRGIPRAEVVSILDSVPEIENESELESKINTVGRPKIEATPEKIALYLTHRMKLSRAGAEKLYGIKRTEHNAIVEAAKAWINVYRNYQRLLSKAN